MIDQVFDSIERPIRSAVIYMGTFTTAFLTWFNPIVIEGMKDAIAICVGLATLAYAVLGIILRIKALRQIRRND